MDADDDRLLDAYLGPHFRKGFDLRAALTPLWPASRGYWAFQLATFVIWIVVAYLVLRVTGFLSLLAPPIVATLAVMILHGAFAGRLRLSSAENARARLAARGQLTGDEAIAHMRRAGGVQWLTLIIMALLVGIPVGYILYPALFMEEHYEERVIAEQRLKYDLNDLAMRQANYFREHGTYTRSLDSLAIDRSEAGGNLAIVAADSAGWSAENKQFASALGRCVIFVGRATPLIRRSNEGVPRCEEVEAR